ncbi:hypothetical protein NSTCB13_06429 [Nostoc sp. DSM 114160]|jgi:hypothetical protein
MLVCSFVAIIVVWAAIIVVLRPPLVAIYCGFKFALIAVLMIYVCSSPHIMVTVVAIIVMRAVGIYILSKLSTSITKSEIFYQNKLSSGLKKISNLFMNCPRARIVPI